MWSDGFPRELLSQNIDNSVENSWWEEEFAQLISPLAIVDQVVQVQSDVLNKGSVGVFVKEQIILDVRRWHVSGNFLVVHMTVLRECQARQVICNSEALLSAHDAKSLRELHLFLINSTETFRWEKTVAILLREHCEGANV